MRLDKTERALRSIREHLEATGAFNTEIESYLVIAALVTAYAEIEQIIQQVEQTSHRGRLKTSELAGRLTGENQRFLFQQRTQSAQRAESYYNNIITNRNSIAHGNSPLNITLTELEYFCNEGHIVLDFFSEALAADSRGATD